MIDKNKINTFLSTLNFILCFIGFQFVTSLLLPLHSDVEGISRTVTVPYRALSLIIALSVIIINIRLSRKYPFALKVFFFYWIILIIRIFYDLYIKSGIFIYESEKIRLWLFIFVICIIPAISIIKSFKHIDLEKAVKWVYRLTIIPLMMSFFSNPILQEAATGRESGNVAINAINFGHLGVMGIIMSLYYISRKCKSFNSYLIVFLALGLSFICMLRSGSRGPILALVVVLSFWIIVHNKHFVRNIVILMILAIVAYVFFEQIIYFIESISPIIVRKLQVEDQLGSRTFLYNTALNVFLNNPILGKQFAIIQGYGGFSYSHNIILDSFMGMGIVGGLTIIYIIIAIFRYSYLLFQKNDPHFWVSLILIQRLMLNMFSSTFYYNQLLSILIIFVFLRYRSIRSQCN